MLDLSSYLDYLCSVEGNKKRYTKDMEKINKRSAWKASLAQKTAKTCQVSERYVRMVINGDRENQDVMNVYMKLWEGENKLLASVKELVGFN